MPKRYVRSNNFWTALVLWGGFWPVAYLSRRGLVFDFENALTVSAGIGLLVAYFGSVKDSLWRNDLDGGHYFVIAVCGIAFSVVGAAAWWWGWRWLDKPDWMEDHLILAFFKWVLLTTFCMLLMAKDVLGGKIPTESWRNLGVVIAIGLALAFVISAVLSPSPAPLVP